MSNMPATVILAQRTKTQLYNTGNVYVYSSRRLNTSANSLTYDVFTTNGNQYPQKPGVHMSTFSRLFDALERYNDLIGFTPLDLVPSTVTRGCTPRDKVDGLRHGGKNAGG
jgi:hypothetical protein